MTFINTGYQSLCCYIRLKVWELAVEEFSRNQNNHLLSMASDSYKATLHK